MFCMNKLYARYSFGFSNPITIQTDHFEKTTSLIHKHNFFDINTGMAKQKQAIY